LELANENFDHSNKGLKKTIKDLKKELADGMLLYFLIIRRGFKVIACCYKEASRARTKDYSGAS
jgi:hypothetical protein